MKKHNKALNVPGRQFSSSRIERWAWWLFHNIVFRLGYHREARYVDGVYHEWLARD